MSEEAGRHVGTTQLACYALHVYAPKIVPARAQRRWMDDFSHQEIYRCLPLTIANAYGWHILCPVPIEIRWNGGTAAADLTIKSLKPLPGGGPVHYFCESNFSTGIVTMHVDYIFRTDPGWNLLVSGPFNSPKENISALSGIVDTDRLSYPFTMNWQMLRPGIARFDEDEPFCAIFPVRTDTVAGLTPEMRSIADAPEIRRQYELLRTARADGNVGSGYLAPGQS